jgi:hypothetical protein
MEWTVSKFGVVFLGFIVLTLLLLFNHQFSGVLGKSTAMHYAVDVSRVADMVASCPSHCEVTIVLPERVQNMEYEMLIEEESGFEFIVIREGSKTRKVPLLSTDVELTIEDNKINIRK